MCLVRLSKTVKNDQIKYDQAILEFANKMGGMEILVGAITRIQKGISSSEYNLIIHPPGKIIKSNLEEDPNKCM